MTKAYVTADHGCELVDTTHSWQTRLRSKQVQKPVPLYTKAMTVGTVARVGCHALPYAGGDSSKQREHEQHLQNTPQSLPCCF